MKELDTVEPATLRQQALPGWRLHTLRSSDMVSLSLDMNYRVLAEFQGSTLLLHRVVKHDLADRASVNRNTRNEAVATQSADTLHASNIYEALLSLGVENTDAEYFSACETEDDLIAASDRAPKSAANLALELYEIGALRIPDARFRVLQKNDDFSRLLEAGDLDWEIYLHPSQAYLVELPVTDRAAVAGSAGTGKTICAWHRAKHLIEADASVGFVCPHDSVLDVSRAHIEDVHGINHKMSYFLVPRQADELVKIAEVVDHIIFDEGQEIPVNWLTKLANEASPNVGITLFYDMNQLGGNIRRGDRKRYMDRINGFHMMLARFPRIRKFSFNINYRNAREISENYLTLLWNALPEKPLFDVPVFEAGEVVRRKVRSRDLDNVVISFLNLLLRRYSDRDIGIVCLDQKPDRLRQVLLERKFAVDAKPKHDSLIVTNASQIRGYERQVMIVTVNDYDALCRNYGSAIEAYIAMSRAVRALIIIEVM